MIGIEQNVVFFVKRTLDLALAVAGLLIASPVMALVTILICLNSPGPVFFCQKRLGYRGRIFNMFKFRTMVDKAWLKGDGLRVTAEDNRITRVGKFLRKSHLDEVPQLINVLKADMSIVGPRPALPFHYDYYEEWEKIRLMMRPGITGWSQINGGNAVNWDRRIEMDVWYVKNWSLWLDIKVILLTLWHVIMRLLGKDDVYAPPSIELWTRGFPSDYFTNSLYTENYREEKRSEE